MSAKHLLGTMALCSLVSELTHINRSQQGLGTRKLTYGVCSLDLCTCCCPAWKALPSQVLVCLVTLEEPSQMLLLLLEPSVTLPGGLCPLHSCMSWEGALLPTCSLKILGSFP